MEGEGEGETETRPGRSTSRSRRNIEMEGETGRGSTSRSRRSRSLSSSNSNDYGGGGRSYSLQSASNNNNRSYRDRREIPAATAIPSSPSFASACSAVIGRAWVSSADAFGDDGGEDESNRRRTSSPTPPRSGREERSYQSQLQHFLVGRDENEEHATQDSLTSPDTTIASTEEDRASFQQLEHHVTGDGDEETGPPLSPLAATPISVSTSFRRHEHIPYRTQTQMATIRMPDDDELSSGASIPPDRIAIERLPRVNISENHVKNTCVICLEPFRLGEEARQMHCGHIFHQRCLFAWLNMNAICPLCRLPVHPA